MATIHTHIRCFNGSVYISTHTAATYYIISFLQRQHLFEAKYILNHCDTAKSFLEFLFVRAFFLLGSKHLCFPQADTKLLATMLTNKDQGLTFAILCFVKLKIILTFGTTDTLHGIKIKN